MSVGRNWLMGCGIGCGVVLLLVVLVVGGSFFALRDAVRGFRQLEDSRTVLVERFGEITDYQPPADGRLSAARIEAFLAVRDTTAEARAAVDRALSEDVPALQQRERGASRVLRGLKTGFGLTGALAVYLKDRSNAMLAHQVGLGEYLYIYCVAYYAGLGKDPAAGPAELKIDTKNQKEGFSWNFGDGDWSRPEERRFQLRTRAHEQLLPMLEHQLAAITDTTSNAQWRKTLSAEIARMREAPERLPWQDGLPDPLRESFEPYRQRFEARWSETSNLLEIMTLEDRQGRSLRIQRGRDEI